MIAGGTHIGHADLLRAGSTAGVLGHRVMAPSTLGTFLNLVTGQPDAIRDHPEVRAAYLGEDTFA